MSQSKKYHTTNQGRWPVVFFSKEKHELQVLHPFGRSEQAEPPHYWKHQNNFLHILWSNSLVRGPGKYSLTAVFKILLRQLWAQDTTWTGIMPHCCLAKSNYRLRVEGLCINFEGNTSWTPTVSVSISAVIADHAVSMLSTSYKHYNVIWRPWISGSQGW